MRVLLLCSLLGVTAGATAATIYKWVDEQGVTHYSDQPHPGAEKIEVESSQTYSAPAPPAVGQSASPETGAESGPTYKRCEIFRPGNDEVLINVPSVSIRLRTEPDMRPGDRAFLSLDGKRIEQSSPDGEFTIAPVYRGTHSVMALVEDSGGRTLCQTATVTFHVRQPSVFAPQNPNRPRPAPAPRS